MVLGIRGIPNVQGGVETHAERLYPRLAARGCEVEVVVRTPFVPAAISSIGPLRLTRIWAPRRSGFEALVHSVLGVFHAAVRRPDVLHIHAIGPAIVAPLARLFGLKVVVTHHGPDYDRDKWGPLARVTLRLGERFGMRFAHARIVISKVIQNLVLDRYGVGSTLIPNGVEKVQRSADGASLQARGLEPGKYFLQVSRVVPEKRQLDLINAFRAANVPGWKLVLVGGLAGDSYSKQVVEAASGRDVILTGFMNGAPLQEIYSMAGVFVLPSSHEGLPIAMLEALSYGLPVIASDIPANLEVGLEESAYFPVGDTRALAHRLADSVPESSNEALRLARMEWVTRKYDWDLIADATLEVYRSVCGR